MYKMLWTTDFVMKNKLSQKKQDLMQADTLVELGNIESDQAYWDDALGYFREALKFYKQYQHFQGIIDTLNSIGLVHAARAEYQQALDAFEGAMLHSHDPSVVSHQGKLYSNKAYVYKMMGQYEMAMRYHSQSLKMHRLYKNTRFEAIVLGNMGNILTEQGHYQQSKEYQLKSLELLRKIQHHRAECLCLHNIAEIYRLTGLIQKARSFYDDAMRIAVDIGERRLEIILQGRLAYLDVLESKKLEGISILEEVCRTCEGLDIPQRAVFYNFIAIEALEKGYLDIARDNLEKGLAVAQEIPEMKARLLGTKARYLIEQGCIRDADALLCEVQNIMKILQVTAKSEIGIIYDRALEEMKHRA